MRHQDAFRRFTITVGLVFCSATPTYPQPAVRLDRDDPPRLGTVVDRIRSVTDTSQSYALYLPSRYRADEKWPILFIMDPRGRALLPLRRFVDAAERYGYILLSSYNTASDFTGADPNDPAFEAMLRDAQLNFSIDSRRIYLAGFSGTARATWALGLRLMGNLAGIIGVGGGLPFTTYQADLSPLRAYPELGIYGLVGTHDFNYEEMRILHQRLDEQAVANRLSFFEGPHAWPPRDQLAHAMAWLELRAMQAQLRSPDSALVDSLNRAELERVVALEESGDLVAAYREYEAITRDFRGLAEVSASHQSAERLRHLASVQHGLQRTSEFGKRFWEAAQVFENLAREVQTAVSPPDPDGIAEVISLPSLLAEAAESADPSAAASSQRILEHIFVHTSFYLPRMFMGQRRTDHALAMLSVAERIFPDRPRVCHVRAQVLAGAGRVDAALRAVRCALRAGLGAAVLAQDAELESLRGLPAFTALVSEP